jgi:predicted RNA-binding protein with TRAM domain
MARWQQGETLELEITDLSGSGDGVGRWDNRVVFVPDTVPGDRIQARLVFTKPSFGRGKLLEVLTPGGDRVRPPASWPTNVAAASGNPWPTLPNWRRRSARSLMPSSALAASQPSPWMRSWRRRVPWAIATRSPIPWGSLLRDR